MNILHIPDVGFHFIWKRDFVSVIRYGVLSRYFFFRLGMKHPGERIFKAQRQAGIDLISIWDPWAFLKRHWKNMPLGSDNQPWLVIDSSIEGYFRDVEEINILRTLKDPDPNNWIGINACQHSQSRKKLDVVRKKVTSLVLKDSPAPELTEIDVCNWIDQELVNTRYNSEYLEPEVCLLLSPNLRRYDFPGYKKFENFVRFRIPPRFIFGVVTNESGASDNQFIETAVSNGIRVYLTDGTSFV